MELLNKNDEIYTMWSNIGDEKDRLRNENMRMISDLNGFLKRSKRLVLKKDYINYKYTEYGDFHKINELFETWSAEYKNATEEAEILKVEYEKESNDVKTIPRVISEIRNDNASLKRAVLIARHEMEQIIEAFPDLEERAKESEEITSKHHVVHKEFVENSKLLTGLRDEFQRANNEMKGLEKRLSEKKRELAPLLKTENSLKSELTEITNRFNKQEELKEEKRALEEVIGHLEESLDERREKIKNHEKKTAEMNKEIKNLKDESGKLTSKVKEYEVMIVPYMELKGRLEDAEKEISLVDEQQKKLTEETDRLKKENEILGAKATQFEELKKMMEGIK